MMDVTLKRARDAYRRLWQLLMAEGLITPFGGSNPEVKECMTTIGDYLTQAAKER